jgi:hypothetical protein
VQKVSDFVLSALHEQELPATHIVEMIVHQSDQRSGVSIKDIADQCVLLTYSNVVSSLAPLVAQGRIVPKRGTNERAMGPKFVTKYTAGVLTPKMFEK